VELEDSDAQAAVYDDLPLWSAPFGLALLERVRLVGVRHALDLGCGAGFPLVELAERLGAGVRVVGLDPWPTGLRRARAKLAGRGVAGVALVRAAAERIPFADGAFDLIVANNGLNNVADADAALAECRRVARPGAQLVATANLPGTMHELYAVLGTLLRERGGEAAVAAMHAHIASKREPVDQIRARLERAGFIVYAAEENAFRMRYASGRALLASWFIRLAFLPSWRALGADLGELALRLDEIARAHGGLTLTIPFVCVEAIA
jgi:arsenite methyltransferase